MPAIGYIRVSTDSQAQEGVSLAAQRAKIEAWSLANDTQLLAIYEDAGASGARSDNRQGLQEAIADTCRHKAVLVVYSLSRLSRSTRDTLALATRLDNVGANLVSLSEKIDTTSASGKMVFRMLAVLNEFERDQVSERTRAALAYKRSNNEKTGGTIPLGYRLAQDGIHLEPDPSGQTTLAVIHSLHKQGFTTRGIAARLKRDDIPNGAGQISWSHVAVAKHLKKVA